MLAASSNIKSSFSVNSFKEERIEQLGVTEDEENVLKETERLWNWCKTILMVIARKPEAEGFLDPVDWKKLKLPLYPNIVKKPMDLGTIKRKLDNSEYFSIFQFDKDMRLVWNNAKKFNQPGSNIYRSAEFLRKEWNKIFRSVKRDPSASKLWAKKARRSKPKKSPRGIIEERSISEWSKHNTKELTNTFVRPSSVDQLHKRQHDGTLSFFKSPKSSQPAFCKVVRKQSAGRPSILGKALPLSLSNLSPRRSRRSQTHVCFWWRKGHCRKGVSCPYKHFEKNTTHIKSRENSQRIWRSPRERDRDKSANAKNHIPIAEDRNNKLSYIGEVSGSPVSNSACNSPPNLGSPRFCVVNTQESGSASLTNVIKWAEEYNKQQTENSGEVTNEYSDPEGLKSEQTMNKQKRKRRPTPVTSPRLQAAKTIKRVRRESKYKLTTHADGSVSLDSFLALNVGQLRRLSEELKLNLSPKMKKKELRLKISSWLKIQSGKDNPKISNLAISESKDQRHPWSPPKAFQNSLPLSPVIIQDRNPEKGVRIIKMSEVTKAYDECSSRNIKKPIMTNSLAANSIKSDLTSDRKAGVLESITRSKEVSVNNGIINIRANTELRKSSPRDNADIGDRLVRQKKYGDPTILPRLFQEKLNIDRKSVMLMKPAELLKLCEKLKLDFPKEAEYDVVRKRIFRLLDCRNNVRNPSLRNTNKSHINMNTNIKPQPNSRDGASAREHLLSAEIEALKNEVQKLRTDLSKSESLCQTMKLSMERRKELETKPESLPGMNAKILLRKVMEMSNTQVIQGKEDEQMGLLWNFENKGEVFGILDQYVDKLDHASRSRHEQPVAILSERQLEMVSYPIEGSIRKCADEISEALCVQTDFMGHVLVPKEDIEITAGFAGTTGNLIWFNTGGCPLILKLKTGKDTQVLILDPGFGFCLGKRGKFTRVFLSSCDRASDKFVEDELPDGRSHAMFFGCSRGDQESWLGALDAEVQAIEFSQDLVSRSERKEIEDNDRNVRLGIDFKNHRWNQIRIAPMRGSNLGENVLSGKIKEVEKWIRETLRCVKSSYLPRAFSVYPASECPRGGEPFDVLWAKFDFDDGLEDDEVMWDIRYLLMGSKMEKLPGFPIELADIREKLFVTRDGFSERGRRVRQD